MTIDEQFNNLIEKLQQLLKQQNRLKKENEQLKAELESQKAEKTNAQNKIQELAQQISILKMGAGKMNEKDKKDFERQINRYVKEIDKCIVYLEQ